MIQKITSLNPSTSQVLSPTKFLGTRVPSQVSAEHKCTSLGCWLNLLGLSFPAHHRLAVSLFSLLSQQVKDSPLFSTSPELTHHFTSWQTPTLTLNNSNNNKVKLRAPVLPMCRCFVTCRFCFRPEEWLVEQKVCLVSFLVCLLFPPNSFLGLIKIWFHLKTNKRTTPKPDTYSRFLI